MPEIMYTDFFPRYKLALRILFNDYKASLEELLQRINVGSVFKEGNNL